MLDHKAGERYGQVVAETLFRRQRGFFAAVLDAEEEFVALFAVFAQQGAEVLHGGRFDALVAEFAEYVLDGVEYIVAAYHFGGSEISGSLGDRRFLCHGFQIIEQQR